MKIIKTLLVTVVLSTLLFSSACAQPPLQTGTITDAVHIEGSDTWHIEVREEGKEPSAYACYAEFEASCPLLAVGDLISFRSYHGDSWYMQDITRHERASDR